MNKTKKQPTTLDVTVEKIVPNGYGLAFAENLTVFVSLAAPGDRLRVRVTERKGRTAFAEIVEVLAPGPQRVQPPCPYFGRCGGCDFQQMSYAAQLAAKAGIVRDCLVRLGRIDFPGEIETIGSPRDFRYRARAQWHLDPRRRRFGYYRRNSHDVIDVENCPIATEELQKVLTDLRADLAWDDFWADKPEIEAAVAGGESSVYGAELIEPTREIRFEAFGERYAYDAQSFFQGNPYLIEELVATALGEARGRAAVDLYCGVGLFTLPLARRFERVVGVEANARALEFARRNAEGARLENVSFVAEPVGEWFGGPDAAAGEVDFLLLDPPRAGAEREAIDGILRLAPRAVSYVSCEPSTLARDLRLLTENLYRIESITAVDLFPQTHHVETVVRLARRD